ncbi:MAG: methyltransferase domain-containing protein, partial [Myxococcales bacterium]|nr:methyltransferase domain-containing protein [Myxococcales bacterium]
VALNLSETQNRRARELNRAAGLDGRIEVIDGNFEDIVQPDGTFDVVWCQDSILHSNQKPRVFQEVHRVLRPSGHFIFTDPMQAEGVPAERLRPVLARIHLEEMGSFPSYRRLAAEIGFQVADVEDLSPMLPRHYARVKDELEKHREALLAACSQSYLDAMTRGLDHWVDAGRAGHLAWGILHFRKAN